MLKNLKKIIFIGILGSCSTTPKVQEFDGTANAADEVKLLKTDLQAARKNQIDVLAPTSYQKADKALDSAISYQKNAKSAEKILHEVAIGRANLTRANQFADLSRKNLEDVAVARQAAIDANAPKLFTNDFKAADEHLRNLTAQIEDNDLDDVTKNRPVSQKEYMDVELKAIQKENLGDARSTIDTAIKEGASEHAKQSLAIAEKTYHDANAFIVANRYQNDDVKTRSLEAKDAADHLLKITRASKAGDNMSSEEAALLIEKEQNKAKDEKNQLKAEKKTAKGLAVETESLKAEQAFNKSFANAQAQFSPSEAEVYRQGDQLVIRLRALAFPNNQSVVKGENFPLLAKVAKVIEGYDGSTVVVEGHTDSIGGIASNQKLSKARAEAISSYFVSNQAIAQDKISVVGYGSERPLASNKTATGKAQNRRVDVVISPKVKDEVH